MNVNHPKNGQGVSCLDGIMDGGLRIPSDCYAAYRLPFQDHYTVVMQTNGSPLELPSCAALSGKEGFVIAPFVPLPDHPILLLRPDVVERLNVEEVSAETPVPFLPRDEQQERFHYAIDFANFHAQLEAGTFQKIVLSRCSQLRSTTALVPEDLFMRACRLYPRMFIALFSTPQSGTWLMATPEILLEGDGKTWHTMALAGTMRLTGEQLKFDNPFGNQEQMPSWSIKNIQEQRYVASYMTECLEQFTDKFREDGPYTARAANLVHLRSDFYFQLKDLRHMGDVIQLLHPTPAVCGLPKDKARDFILKNELVPRNYYSGFVGPLNPFQDTHLYVSLRCMQIRGNEYDLYAGGGLLASSQEESEWNETEAKLETMKRVLSYV